MPLVLRSICVDLDFRDVLRVGFVMHPDYPPFLRVSFPTWCFSRDAPVHWFDERGFVLVEHFTQNLQQLFDVCGMLFARA